MKKLLILLLAVALTASFSGLAMAVGNGAGINGSPHDLRGQLGGKLEFYTGKAEICRVCHAPHDHMIAQQRYLNGLLWNHEVTQATYVMYDNTWGYDLNGTVMNDVVGVSKLCLSCHDGTVAVDAFDQYATGTKYITDWGNTRQIPGFQTANGDLDLRGTHPISIEYKSYYDGYADGDQFLYPKTSAMGLSGTIDDVLDHSTVAGAPGSTIGLVQCSSCHDVHDSPGEAVPGTPLLRVDLAGSQICLTCHMK